MAKVKIQQYAQMVEFKRIFDLFDVNDDGTISPNYLGTVMRLLGYNPTEEDVADVVMKVGLDEKGRIGFQTFLTIMAREMRAEYHERMMREAFKVFDPFQTGYIMVEELREIFTRDNLSGDEIDEIIQESGINKENTMIKYEKIVKLLARM